MPILKKKQKQPHPARVLLTGFTTIIIFGAVLLSLPICSADGSFTNFLDSLFTATSATCVTGITIFDTFSHYSYFGQGVLLMLIQVGGMGFLTFVTFFFLIIGKNVGWSAMKMATIEMTNNSYANSRKLIRDIMLYTFGTELIGAILLLFSFVPKFGGYGVFIAIFTSISAFCNAGFDLMSADGISQSLSGYTGDPLVMITMMLLIIMGGIGFVVWQNVIHIRKVKKLSLHAKIVFIMTAILILTGALTVFIAEYNNPATLGNMELHEKILSSFMMSVSSRSAGFSCYDINAMTSASKVVLVMLMFIGSAPTSTGSGIKITTIAIIAATVKSVLKGEEETTLLGHRIKRDAVYKTLTVTILSLIIVGLSCVLIIFIDNFSMQNIIFEVVAGFSTGFSTGISADMQIGSKIVMILTMIAGRLGPVTLMMTLVDKSNKHGNNKILPEGEILVG